MRASPRSDWWARAFERGRGLRTPCCCFICSLPPKTDSRILQLCFRLSLSPPLAVARSRRAPVEGSGSSGEMRRCRGRHDGGGVAASLAAALLCGCVMLALAGAVAAQGPRLPSAYKTLSGKARPCPSATLWTRVRRLLCFSSCSLFIREVSGRARASAGSAVAPTQPVGDGESRAHGTGACSGIWSPIEATYLILRRS